MKIRTVIPILNNQWLTVGALHSLRSEMEELDVVLVDNGSTDESLACLRADIDQPGSGVRLIKNERPRAYSRSVNMGAALKGDWDALLVTNNDVIYAPGSIQEMARGLGGLHELVLPLSPRDVAAMGISPPRLARPGDYKHVMANDEAVREWWAAHAQKFGGYSVITHPYVAQGGYSFLITRNLWERLGGMDEGYELFGEDYDLFDRATRWTKLLQARSAYVEHLEHQSVAWLGQERDIRMARARFRLAEQRENLRELVSVVIPTFNRVEALFEAVDSVLRQTMPHWKLYVVDDGSKDWDRIMKAAQERYRGHESRIWFFHLPKNAGPGAARNFAMDVASGKYVAFLDSDDIWRPKHLEKHLALHENNPGLLMSYSRTSFAWRWWDEDTRRFRYREDRPPEEQLQDPSYSRERLERENFIKTSAVFVNGAVLRRDTEFSEPIRFPVESDHRMAAEDWSFFRMVADRGPVALLDEFTARTHWSKLADGEAHHSSRIIPWADFGEVSPDWLAREIALPELSGPITVVVPTRERTEEVVRLLDVLRDVPVMIAADGLKSGRPLIPLTQERPNMGLVIVDEPKGPSFARNRAVEAVRSPWVWLLDDDDVPVPGALAAIEEHLEGADVVIGDLIVSAEGGLKSAQGLFTSAMFVRVEAYQRAGGFDEGLRWAEERELLPRLEKAGAVVKKVAMPVAIKTVGSFKALSLAQAPKISPEVLRSTY